MYKMADYGDTIVLNSVTDLALRSGKTSCSKEDKLLASFRPS